MLNKSTGINLALAFASLCVVDFCRAQAAGPTVETPTSRTALIDLSSNGNGNDNGGMTVASEFKSTAKNVVEQEKPVFWNWYAEFGYTSEYIFRGTNLLPDADGAMFLDLEVSKWGFTLGATDYYQLGTARSDSWSIGEGGGGGSGNFGQIFNGLVSFSPETIQSYFNEIDVFLQYHREFGPVDVTVGNIGFFIDRNAQTFYDVSSPFFPTFRVGPIRTVKDEEFDRVYVRVATSVIPHIQPGITYYQTIYSEGEDPGIFAGGGFPAVHERNNALGGYLEGRLRGNFSVGQWLDINPYGVISVSFHDRTEPVENPVKFHDFIRAKTLSGWNHAQVGLETPIHLLHFAGSSDTKWAPPDVRVSLVPFGAYSHHISNPTVGTDRNEWWGGAKIAVTF
jgi:hypothetical protein